ncbi:hypothetical protein BBJ28_00000432 [Nothophytophthora sp. Chile5]|nr:hypothetical protein BBJ28_00000432 [Nothophytophthora sp. Chile5]
MVTFHCVCADLIAYFEVIVNRNQDASSLGVALVLLALIPEVVGADCAAGSSTLTTEGCSACDSYALCLGFSSADACSGSDCETDGDCTYQCMSVDADTSTLVVLVVFGGYKSSEEVAAIEAGTYTSADLTGSSYPDLTSEWPSVNNDRVAAIDTIDLSSAVTSFMLSGGNSTLEYPKGKVASVTFSSDLISSETSVTQVVLHNLDLQQQVDSLSDILPSSVEVLNIGNSLVSSFPTAVGGLTSLQELYVVTLHLSMQQNNVESFAGVFTNLEYLYLNDNNLTQIPASIYSHSKLIGLNLTGNSFESLAFTQDEVDFLTNLSVLGLTASDFVVDLDCDVSEQVAVHDVTVCLSDESTAGTVSDGTSSSSLGSASVDSSGSSATSSSSSNVSVIVGIVCGIFVVIVIAVVWVIYRRRQKKNQQQNKLSDTEGHSGDHFPSLGDDRRHRRGYGGLMTSSGVAMGIPMSASGVPMGIPTTNSEAPTGIATSTGSESTADPTTVDSGARTQAGVFLSIWNDPELLSLQVRAEDIEDLKQLGSGAFAMVWLVRYRNSQLLASKRLRPERRSKKHTSTFVEEIKLIANFDHPNLVKLIGAAWTIESDLQALLEYMNGGDLRQYLSDPNTPRAWSSIKFGMAIGIIEALVYLHSFVPPLVHRDLKSRNVLLSSDLKAKLSDFGTSRFRSLDNTMTAGVGTGRWLAPEVITGDTNYGPAVDVYSFGVLLTELDTNQIPYSNAHGPNGKKLSDMTILHQVATGKLRPQTRATCEPALMALVNRCLVEDPAKRPPATVIAYELRVIQKDMAASL